MNAQYEEEIISRFILPDKKSRYRFALPRASHRYGILIRLFANEEIDFRFAEPYHGVAAFAALSSIGKNAECYVLSCNEDIDGKIFSWNQAMESNDSLGIFIYYTTQRAAYFKGEHGDEYILHNPS